MTKLEDRWLVVVLLVGAVSLAACSEGKCTRCRSMRMRGDGCGVVFGGAGRGGWLLFGFMYFWMRDAMNMGVACFLDQKYAYLCGWLISCVF